MSSKSKVVVREKKRLRAMAKVSVSVLMSKVDVRERNRSTIVNCSGRRLTAPKPEMKRSKKMNFFRVRLEIVS